MDIWEWAGTRRRVSCSEPMIREEENFWQVWSGINRWNAGLVYGCQRSPASFQVAELRLLVQSLVGHS